MSFFNNKIYCKQNLKPEDRERLEAGEKLVESIIEKASYDYETDVEDDEEIDAFAKIKKEVVESFVEYLKYWTASVLQDELIGLIDNYEEDVEEVEDPEFFEYVEDGD